MKSERTLRRWRNECRRLIDDPTTDVLVARLAYIQETLLRQVTEKVVGWGTPAQQAKDDAILIRNELGIK